MGNRQENWLVMGLIVLVEAVAPCMAANTEELTLLVYDYAHLSPEAIAKAESTVSRIFEHLNVHVIWRNGFPDVAQQQTFGNLPEDPAALLINIQPESNAARYGVGSTCGGIALGSRAIVFARGFDSMSTKSAATRLGYALAHELGHIMLGRNAHAIVGIMRGTLLPDDWQSAAQCTLGFTRSQQQQIRAWIAERGRLYL
jgi:hypothetical protein